VVTYANLCMKFVLHYSDDGLAIPYNNQRTGRKLIQIAFA
jgi:hypothetical protein